MTTTGRLGADRVLVDGEFVDGDASIDEGRISSLGLTPDGAGLTGVAGFVDLQVNGFAGVDFSTSDAAGYRRAGGAMAATGVTSFQPTFITLPWASYPAALRTATEASDTPGMIGVHLEGPFIAPKRHGAHNAGNITLPTSDRVTRLAGEPVVTWVTIAPEVDGALNAIATFVESGKRVAVGHSDATADIARHAFDRGARSVTHLFNAQRGLHHREPGIAAAALTDRRVVVTLILDGHHLAPEIVRLVFQTAPGRVALITDAIAANTHADGLGDRTAQVVDDRATLPDGTLAGSVLTMDVAIRNAVELGIPLVDAIAAASSTPARFSGIAAGDLATGRPSDVALLDQELSVVRTLRRGAVVYES